MEFLNITFRLLAISQVALFTLFIAFSSNPNRVKIVGIGLMLGAISYIGMPLIEAHTPYMPQLRYLWLLGAIAPSLLLLFVFFIFEESCEVPIWIIVLVLVSVGFSIWYQIFDIGLPGSPLWLHILKGIIIVIAITIVWRGREADLVEIRAKVRTVFVMLLAIETLTIISLEVATDFSPPILLDTIMQFCILVCMFCVNFFFTRLNPQSELMRRTAVAPTQSIEPADPIITELLKRMREERLYADHDLRVATLAQLLGTPEYKLRKKINQELGYRNFNQFVNNYRIEEAGVKLREDARTPVLTIALDVGFRSISSFNTAFQTHFGLSPTKYRAESQ